ncbi:hypothetical protein [Streptomyces rugosispiralis]|uniref:Uncharacterized protein n=1 Tax=Streptomyces rugosispiralis TaxID=2967341 RepID=A0ABT1UZ33_9ACTN|nr:hypothetical protein [Streptomyces rugosispiralis]MCQ8190063.1 hypothetical protein [Streptomyces rugosispiralis]
MAPPGVAQDPLPRRCPTLFTGFDGVEGQGEAEIPRRAMAQVSAAGTGRAEAGCLRLGAGLARCPYDGQRATEALETQVREPAGRDGPVRSPRRAWGRAFGLRALARTAARGDGEDGIVRDRLVAVADPRGEVLGALPLVDPEGRADERAVRALDHAATSLGLEPAHLREPAEVELRLRRELVDDLLSGADDTSLLALHADTAALVAQGTPGERSPHSALSRALGTGSGAIGVGASCDTPSERGAAGHP